VLYLIIFGTRGVTYTHAKGQFFCPDCGDERPYQQKRVRRFFTLYFIPLIPLDLLGEYVECSGCHGTYKPGVLEYHPSKALPPNEAEFSVAMRRVMVLMMLADGVVDEQEIATIQDVFGKIAKRNVERAEIEKEIADAKSSGATVEDYCRKMTGSLNESGKEMVVRSAYLVAAADGKFEEAEKSLLSRIAKALELSPATYRGIVVEMTEERAA
jgi:tellurite resistance protein